MSEKPTYQELEQRIKNLEKEFIIHQQAEEALREREATLRSIFRAAPTGIGVVCNRVIRQANERLCQMLGYSHEELLGKNARILYPSDEDFEYVGKEKYAQMSIKGTGTIETRWQCKDGKIIDVFLSSTPIDPNDWSIGVTFTALDITERKKAEKALDESEERYRALFENMIDGIAVYEAKNNGEDFLFVDLNKAGEKISATSRVNVLGQSVLEMFPGVKDIGLFKVFQNVWKTGKTTRHPPSLYKDYRISRWVENAVYKLPSGEIAAVYSDETQRKQAEEALKQAHDDLEKRVQERTDELTKINEKLKQEIEVRKQTEKWLTSIFDASQHVSFIITDLNGTDARIMEFSRGAEHIFGYSREEAVGQPVAMLHLPEDVIQFPEVFDVMHQNKTGFIGESTLVRKSGDRFKALFSTAPLFDSKGRMIAALGVAIDISKRATAEKTLQKSEAHFRNLFEQSNDGIIIHKAGQIINANQQICAMLGYTKDQLLDMTLEDLHSDKRRQIVRERIDTVCRTGSIRFETKLTRADGTGVYVEVSSKLVDNKNHIVQGIVRDITLRKQGEAALRESEERFRVLVEQAADGIIAHDLDGQIVFVNEQAVQSLGYTKEELLSLNIAEIDAHVTQENYKEKYWKKLLPNQPVMIETTSRRKYGGSFPAEVRLVQIILRGEKIILGFGRDITERKQAEKELRQREMELGIQSQHLQEVNLALKVLLKRRDGDKKELQENIVANVKELVVPYLDKLSQGKLDERQKSYLNLAQTNINDIISPYIGNLSSKHLQLTPTEIQVASQIKHGKTTKEIAVLLNLSVETIKFHRKNIRKKIGIKNKKANLRTYLVSM